MRILFRLYSFINKQRKVKIKYDKSVLTKDI